MGRWISAVVATLVAFSASDAWGDDRVGAPSPDPQAGALQPVLHDDDPNDEFAAFPLVVRHDKHFVRAGLEVGAVVVIGFVDYLLNTSARGGIVKDGDRMWDLRYAWPDLRGKLVGEAYELDANRFATNYAAHPFAGTMYYTVARSNHLGFVESALFSTLGSATWEYFGEIRERVSVNDLIATPAAGIAIGESTMQLAGFFARGKNNASNRLLSFFFAPVKTVNEIFDGAETKRDEHLDALGFPSQPWHRFEIFAGGASTFQEKSRTPSTRTTGRAYPDLRFGVELEVANLPGYRGTARHARLFDDGNLSSLSVTGALSEGSLVDILVQTRIVPIGYYWRDAQLDKQGHLDGRTAILGLRMGFEYGMHDYDRERLRGRDLVSVVSPIGIAAEHTFERGGVRVRTGLDISGSLTGVTPYALTDYLAQQRSTAPLLTAIKNNGYYHAVGVSAAPYVEANAGDFRLATKLRLDSFRAIQGLDESDAVDRSLAVADRRALGSVTLGWHPSALPVHVAVGIEHRERAGDLGPAHARRGETSLSGRLGLVF